MRSRVLDSARAVRDQQVDLICKRFVHVLYFTRRLKMASIRAILRVLNSLGTCNLNSLDKLKPQLFYQGKIILGNHV